MNRMPSTQRKSGNSTLGCPSNDLKKGRRENEMKRSTRRWRKRAGETGFGCCFFLGSLSFFFQFLTPPQYKLIHMFIRNMCTATEATSEADIRAAAIEFSISYRNQSKTWPKNAWQFLMFFFFFGAKDASESINFSKFFLFNTHMLMSKNGRNSGF